VIALHSGTQAAARNSIQNQKCARWRPVDLGMAADSMAALNQHCAHRLIGAKADGA